MNTQTVKRLFSGSTMMVMLTIFSLSPFSEVKGQCLNTVPFGSVIAPVVEGIVVNITSCAFAGEYSTINNVVAGSTYTLTSSMLTDFITVRQGTYNGPVLGTGTGSVVVTPTASGAIYMHVNTNDACGTQMNCRLTTISLGTANDDPPVAPVPVSGWSLYVGIGLILVFLTYRFFGRPV